MERSHQDFMLSDKANSENLEDLEARNSEMIYRVYFSKGRDLKCSDVNLFIKTLFS